MGILYHGSLTKRLSFNNPVLRLIVPMFAVVIISVLIRFAINEIYLRQLDSYGNKNLYKYVGIVSGWFVELIAGIKENSNVVVCGSLAGGTGAGVLPILAKYIKQERGSSVKIVGFLKWFELDDNAKAEDIYKASEHTDDRRINDILEVNTESGFCYLMDKISKDIDSCVLLGLDDLFKVKSEDVGKQKEKRHLITLIAAVISNNFFYGKHLKNDIYGYHIPEEGLHPYNVDVFLPNEMKITIDKVFMLNKAMISFLKLIEDYLEKGIPKLPFPPITISRFTATGIKTFPKSVFKMLISQREER